MSDTNCLHDSSTSFSPQSPSQQRQPSPELHNSPSVMSQKTTSYNIKDETVYKLVDHSVGAIALECGYHMAHQSSLDILTDVCCDYFKKIATLLRIAHDTEEWRDSESDFVDSLERVFHQINIPSAANLHQFICKMEAFKKHQTTHQCNK